MLRTSSAFSSVSEHSIVVPPPLHIEPGTMNMGLDSFDLAIKKFDFIHDFYDQQNSPFSEHLSARIENGVASFCSTS